MRTYRLINLSHYSISLSSPLFSDSIVLIQARVSKEQCAFVHPIKIGHGGQGDPALLSRDYSLYVDPNIPENKERRGPSPPMVEVGSLDYNAEHVDDGLDSLSEHERDATEHEHGANHTGHMSCEAAFMDAYSDWFGELR